MLPSTGWLDESKMVRPAFGIMLIIPLLWFILYDTPPKPQHTCGGEGASFVDPAPDCDSATMCRQMFAQARQEALTYKKGSEHALFWRSYWLGAAEGYLAEQQRLAGTPATEPTLQEVQKEASAAEMEVETRFQNLRVTYHNASKRGDTEAMRQTIEAAKTLGPSKSKIGAWAEQQERRILDARTSD